MVPDFTKSMSEALSNSKDNPISISSPLDQNTSSEKIDQNPQELTKNTILFVTGRLAEPSLIAQVKRIADQIDLSYQIEVLPITVAALLTTDWIAPRLKISPHITKVILPGLCRGDLNKIANSANIKIERGPNNLQDLPEYFGIGKKKRRMSGEYNIEILAEINHADQLSLQELTEKAKLFQSNGADVIDLGCTPSTLWNTVEESVNHLRKSGIRVSIDSFNSSEIISALRAGAESVLSVNSNNVDEIPKWLDITTNFEVIVIPDSPDRLETIHSTIEKVRIMGVPFRIDPILEPIGFGFAQSLGRFIEIRKQYPDSPMMMGIGNLTELTDVDSAGIQVLLAGFCQELNITKVLTTQVVNWCRTAIQEFDSARKLVFTAVTEKVLPKRLSSELLFLRDSMITEQGPEVLEELARRIKDRHYRIFAERGEIHILNHSIYVRGKDPFELFEQICKKDNRMDSSHAFYLGYELSKAMTALTLGKNYRQDQALNWGILTIPESSSRNPGHRESE